MEPDVNKILDKLKGIIGQLQLNNTILEVQNEQLREELKNNVDTKSKDK